MELKNTTCQMARQGGEVETPSSAKMRYRSLDGRSSAFRYSWTPEVSNKRSARREEFLAKRRSGSFDQLSPYISHRSIRRPSSNSKETLQHHGTLPRNEDRASRVNLLISSLQSTSFASKFAAVSAIRKLTTIEESAQTDILIQCGALRPLVEMLAENSTTGLKFEASWALSNIAAGTSQHTLAVVAEGALKPLVALLKHINRDLVAMAVWAIGNIVADNGHFRDLAVENGLLASLLPLMDEADSDVLQNVSWLVVNMCRTKNPPPSTKLISALSSKLKLLVECRDEKIRVSGIWCLAYLSDNSADISDILLEDVGVLDLLSNLPEKAGSNISFLLGGVRTIGNLLSGSDAQCDAVLQAGFIEALVALLPHPHLTIQKETLSCLANVSAGSFEQIEAILTIPGLLSRLFHFIAKDNVVLQEEAVWIVANIAQGGSLAQITALLEAEPIKPLCRLLHVRSIHLLKLTSETLLRLLKRCPTDFFKPLCSQIEKCGGLRKIELLLHNDDDWTYELCYEIIELCSRDDNNDKEPPGILSDLAGLNFEIPHLSSALDLC